MNKAAVDEIHGLKNTLTDDQYLARWGRKYIPGFRGVMSYTEFKSARIRPGDSVIVNLDPGWSQGGTHWTALRRSSESPVWIYKDSFGAPPPRGLIAEVKRSADPTILYGTNINQKIDASNCGKLALSWLKVLADAAADGREMSTFEMLEE
jgi:hypothetical protein